MKTSERAALKRLLKQKDAESVGQGLALYEALAADDQDAVAAGVGVDPVLGGLDSGPYTGPLGTVAALGLLARAREGSETRALAQRLVRFEHRVNARHRDKSPVWLADVARLPALQKVILVGVGPVVAASGRWQSTPSMWLERVSGSLDALAGSGVEELVLVEQDVSGALPDSLRVLALLKTTVSMDAVWALPRLEQLHVSYASPAIRNQARVRGVRLTHGATLA